MANPRSTPYIANAAHVLLVPDRTTQLQTPANYTDFDVRQIPVNLIRVGVDNKGVSAGFIMVFSGNAEPATGAKPLLDPVSVAASGSAALSLMPLGAVVPSPGLVVAMSTTADTYTADGNNYNISVITESWESTPTGITAAGAKIADGAACQLQVWTEAAGPKTLVRVQFTPDRAQDLYAVVYAVDTPTATSKVIAASSKVVKVATNPSTAGLGGDLWFGSDGGIIPLDITTDGVKHQGCTVFLQTAVTAAAAPANMTAGSLLVMAAWYK